MLHTQERGTKIADGIKFADQLILRNDYADNSDESYGITRCDVEKGGTRVRKDVRKKARSEWCEARSQATNADFEDRSP